ncbi:hypothetical protein ACFE04_020098 [Oxalis oulophora]
MNNNNKRALDSSSADEGDRKRPALASVIVEALKVDSLQKLCSSLEPILRRVVSEEVERALAKLGTTAKLSRASPKRLQNLDGRNLQLCFRSKLSLPLFTGGKVEAEQGGAIHISLIDGKTGHVVASGSESSAKLDVIVLEGDFNNEDCTNWTQEEFDSHIVKEREGKRPLLTGDLQVILKNGMGALGELTFTDNSSWIRSRKFRLGLKVSTGCCEGIRIREAKTDAFTVKDHRGELYKKHYPPSHNDEVWRLEKIGKDGSFHKRLNKAGIYNVEDFLRLVVRDSQRLRNILGSGMSNKMWDVLVEHAKTCVLSGKLYVFYPDEARNVGVVFNSIYELSGLVANGQYYSAESLSENQKVHAASSKSLRVRERVFVDGLVKQAYENWMHVIEYDSKSLLGFEQNEDPQTDVKASPLDYSDTFNEQVTLPTISVPTSTDHHPADSGYNDSMAARFSSVNLNAHEIHSYSVHNPLMNNLQPQTHSSQRSVVADVSSRPGPSSHVSSFKGLEKMFSEEEIHMKTHHEMLENEEMQHLLRLFNNREGPSDGNPYSSSYNIPNIPPNYSFSDDQSRSSDKAVAGWLKLKAALRWGMFVRKKAAERRAQIVELDNV